LVYGEWKILEYAVESNDVDTAKVLLSNPAFMQEPRPDPRNSCIEYKILLSAVKNDNLNMVKALLENAAFTQKIGPDSWNSTMANRTLLSAVQGGNEDIVKALCKNTIFIQKLERSALGNALRTASVSHEINAAIIGVMIVQNNPHIYSAALEVTRRTDYAKSVEYILSLLVIDIWREYILIHKRSTALQEMTTVQNQPSLPYSVPPEINQITFSFLEKDHLSELIGTLGDCLGLVKEGYRPPKKKYQKIYDAIITQQDLTIDSIDAIFQEHLPEIFKPLIAIRNRADGAGQSPKIQGSPTAAAALVNQGSSRHQEVQGISA
jgi:hypothetical protein